MFQDRLREARLNIDLTQLELSIAAGINPTQLSHFETGNRMPSVVNIIKLADALDVSIDWLLEREIKNRLTPLPCCA